jgi:hypothetical protein
MSNFLEDELSEESRSNFLVDTFRGLGSYFFHTRKEANKSIEMMDTSDNNQHIYHWAGYFLGLASETIMPALGVLGVDAP